MPKSKVEVRPTPARLTKESLAEFVALDLEQRACESRARKLKDQTDPMRTLIAEELAKAKKDSVVRCGFTLLKKLGARYPAWKQAFIARLGVEAAEAVQKETPPSVQVWAVPAKIVDAE